MKQNQLLEKGLDLGLQKRGKERAAVAYTDHGMYLGADFQSETKLLRIPAEQVALLRAIQHGDYGVHSVTTLDTGITVHEVDPIIMKILVDFSRRTGRQINYTILSSTPRGPEVLAEVRDVSDWPAYHPQTVVLSQVKDVINSQKGPTSNIILSKQVDSTIKSLAQHGAELAFTTEDKAKRYGSVAISSEGVCAISGQYSGFEGQTTIHAEIGAVIALMMEGYTPIEKVGVISTRHTDRVCDSCGVCRQFMHEVMTRTHGPNIQVSCFAFDANDVVTHGLAEYLPSAWSSK